MRVLAQFTYIHVFYKSTTRVVGGRLRRGVSRVVLSGRASRGVAAQERLDVLQGHALRLRYEPIDEEVARRAEKGIESVRSTQSVRVHRR